MINYIKIILLIWLISILMISGGYFLSGEWRNEYHDESKTWYSPGEPVFEIVFREYSCISTPCINQENCWNYKCKPEINSNDLFMYLGTILFIFTMLSYVCYRIYPEMPGEAKK